MDDLGARLSRGDADALAALYDRLHRRAFGLAYRVLRDPQAAEDAVHDAFLDLWRRAARIDPAGGSLDSLALTIVHRRAVDLVRQRARRAETVADAIDARATAILDRAAEALDHERVRQALLTLNPEHRTALELAFFEERSQREIALETGVPIGTVKSRLHHAMRRLRDALGIRVDESTSAGARTSDR